MELTVLATTLALSIGLGLAGARAMLSIVFFWMAQSAVRTDAVHAMRQPAADIVQTAPASQGSLALSARTT